MHRLAQTLGCGALSAVLFMPSVADAVCPEGLISQAARVHVSQALLDQGTALAKMYVPESVSPAGKTFELMACGNGSTATLTTHDVLATPTLERFGLTAREGAIDVDTRASLHISSGLRIKECDGSVVTCSVTASLTNAHLLASAVASVDACQASVALQDTRFSLDPYAVSIAFDGCGMYGDVADLAFTAVRELAINLGTQVMVPVAEEEVNVLLGGLTREVLAKEMLVQGLRAQMAIETVAIDASGIDVVFAGNITAQEAAPSHCGVVSPYLEVDEPTPLPEPLPGHTLTVALSKRLINRVLGAAHARGWMCATTGDLGLDLGAALAEAVPNVALSAVVRMPYQPYWETSATLDVVAPSVEVEVEAKLADHPPSRVLINTSARVRVNASVDSYHGNMCLEPLGIDIGELTITTTSGDLFLNDDALRELVRNAVMPLLPNHADRPLLTSEVLASLPIVADLGHVDTIAGDLRVGLVTWPVDQNDREPPTTLVAQQPEHEVSPRFGITMASYDAATPVRFLQHALYVDGVPQGALARGIEVYFDGLAAGEHTIGLAAVDLVGNEDDTPETMQVTVDDTPPVIELTDVPIGVTDGPNVALALRVTDDIAPAGTVAVRYAARLVGETKKGDIAWSHGVVRNGRIELASIPMGSVVDVVITATDRAGNTSTASHGFAVMRRGGCSASSPTYLLACLAPLWLARRRKRAW